MNIEKAEKLVNLNNSKKSIQSQIKWLKNASSDEICVQLKFKKKPSPPVHDPMFVMPVFLPEALPTITYCYKSSTEEHRLVLKNLILKELEGELLVINEQIKTLEGV